MLSWLSFEPASRHAGKKRTNCSSVDICMIKQKASRLFPPETLANPSRSARLTAQCAWPDESAPGFAVLGFIPFHPPRFSHFFPLLAALLTADS
jgi:hypothetical protein